MAHIPSKSSVKVKRTSLIKGIYVTRERYENIFATILEDMKLRQRHNDDHEIYKGTRTVGWELDNPNAASVASLNAAIWYSGLVRVFAIDSAASSDPIMDLRCGLNH